MASWVVSNRIAQIRYSANLERVSANSKTDNVKMGGYEWRVRSVVEESSLDRVFLVTVEARDKSVQEDAPVASMTSSVENKL